MSIQSGDIKLLKSQVLLDTSDGGGAMTSNEDVDGLSNNLFADISELDRTYGRVSLRKGYAAVTTTSVDSYYGFTKMLWLKQHQPQTIGQASRIQGMTPAAISILLVYLKRAELAIDVGAKP